MKKIKTAIKILIAEHDTHDLAMIDNELKKGGIDFVSEIVQNEAGYRKTLKNFIPDIILCEYRFPSFDGPTAFKIREQLAPETPFILVSGAIGEEYSIELIKNGVTDFVLKDKIFTLTTKLLRGLKEANERKEKNKIEHDLKQTAAHLAEAQSLAKLGSWDYDFADNKLTWSEQLYNVFDTDKQTFNETHGSFLHLIDEADREYAEKTSKHTQETGEAFRIEYGITTHKGEKRVIQEHGYGVKDATGKVIRLFGTAQDITERKKAEDAVLFILNEKNTILESIGDAFFAIDKDWVVTYWNNHAEKMLGVSKKDIVGRNLWGVIKDSIDSESFRKYHEAVETNQVIQFEDFYLPMNRWYEISAYPSEAGLSVYFKDITERKKSEEKIKESEARLAASQSVAKVGSWETDLTNLDVIWSDETYRIFGVDKLLPHTSHQNFLKFVHPDDKEKVDNAFAASFTSDSLNSIEHRIIAADGILKEVEERWHIAIDENGKPVRALGTVQDITERKKADKAVKESEAKYRAFFENNIDGILLTVTDGSILAANPAACEMFRMTEEEICASGRFGIIDNADPRAENLIKQRQLTGKASGELTYLRKDGTTFPGEISSALFTDSFGQERTSMIIRDISYRIEIEERLALTSGKLQSALNDLTKIMDSSMDVICAVDAKGNFLKVSAASETVLGYKPGELIGKPVIDFVYYEDKETTQLTAANVMAGNSLNHFENRYVRKDGSLVPIEWSARWDEKDQIRYGIARDVTVKKRLEKAFEIERQQFYDLFAEVPTSMGILIGPDHKYQMVNPMYLQLIGKKDVIGKSVKEVLPEVIDQGFIEILDGVYKTGKTFSANEMVIKIDLCGNGQLVDRYLNFIYQAHKTNENTIDGILFFAVDVTEQVLSRKTIEESERKLKEAQAIARISNWEINLETNTHQWSSEFYDIMRIKEEEVNPSAEAFLSLLHPDDVEQAKERMQNTFDTFQESFFYSRINTNDGIVRFVYSEWKFEYDKTNKPIRLYGILQDVTERKIAEEKLNTSNRFFAFISAINHSIVHIKEEDELLQKACSIAMEIGKFKSTWIALLNAEDKLEVTNVPGEWRYTDVTKKRSGIDVQNSPFQNIGVGKALRNGIYAVSNDVLNDPDMHFLKEELLNTGIRANIVFPIKKSGKVTGVFSFNSDTVNFFDEAEIVLLQEATNNISFAIENFDKAKQHKKAEEKIIDSEKRLQLATSSAALGIWDWDIKNNILTWDEGMYRLYNILGTEFNSVYEGWISRLHQDDRQQVENHMQLALANKKDYNPEFRIVWGDSSVHYINASGIIERDKNGNAIRMIGINWDVTESKLAEIHLNKLNENLQKNAKELLISNAELEQFAYVASHDLQEPLRMVTSFLTQLEKKYVDIIDDKGKQYIAFAVDGAKRMRQIILDLLEFSRVGRMEEDKGELDLNDLLQEIKMLFQKKIEEKKAVIIIDPLPKINNYRSPLYQVFQNLVSNALQYSGKEIPTQIHVKVKELKDHWQFAVIDNGIGIEKEYFDKIFIIFQRLHTKEEYSGTGMGLAITKKIIDAQGGKIWVESEQGKGSAFYFTINK